ncbi:unnamed protein product [Caenorhabditis angaria]|uniref:Uncharacterized protein n=1 Tax=Caenorhabditis angaria TaxID=860376 RepID=A0A9P1J033_9PELO|nr:unnamed protein product [Caenorhabditis angaria]
MSKKEDDTPKSGENDGEEEEKKEPSGSADKPKSAEKSKRPPLPQASASPSQQQQQAQHPPAQGQYPPPQYQYASYPPPQQGPSYQPVPTQPQNPGPSEQDVERGKLNPTKLLFSEGSIRAAFVRKVFLVVTIMFMVVGSFCAIPIFWSDFKRWCQRWAFLYYLAYIVFLVIYLILACCRSVRRNYPCNIIMLCVFTVAASIMCMFFTAQFNTQSVFLALLITTLCSAAIVAFAMFTNKDLTTCYGVAFILSVCLLLFGLFAIIFVVFLHWYFLYLIYAICGALLAMFYLAIDIQWIMGGRSHECSPEDWIYASLELFMDFLSIFMFILSILGFAE